MKYPPYVDADEVARAFARIAEAVIDARVDFLLGAGMSYDSAVPIGPQLAATLLRRFFPEEGTDPPSKKRIEELVSQFPFEGLVEAVQAAFGNTRADLTKYLKEILLNPTFELKPAHHGLLSVCTWSGAPAVSRIFTTHFDKLLDVAFGGLGRRITRNNTHAIQEAQRKNLIPILYLHGTLEEDDYQITETDVYDEKFNALHMTFRAALNEADAFVFVGYSMNDPDFRRLYHSYRSDVKARATYEKRTFVISPIKQPDDRYEYILGRQLWSARGAIWLPLTAAEVFSHLKTILETKGSKTVQQFIMRKYGFKTEPEYWDRVKQTAEILRISNEDATRFLAEARTKTGKSA